MIFKSNADCNHSVSRQNMKCTRWMASVVVEPVTESCLSHSSTSLMYLLNCVRKKQMDGCGVGFCQRKTVDSGWHCSCSCCRPRHPRNVKKEDLRTQQVLAWDVAIVITVVCLECSTPEKSLMSTDSTQRWSLLSVGVEYYTRRVLIRKGPFSFLPSVSSLFLYRVWSSRLWQGVKWSKADTCDLGGQQRRKYINITDSYIYSRTVQ